MSANETPDQTAGGSRTTTTKSTPRVPPASADLIRRADRAVRAALREGVSGPDVEELLSWVTEQRVLLRRQSARAAVSDALGAVRSRGAA